MFTTTVFFPTMQLFYLSNAFIPSKEANSIQVMKMCQAFAGQGAGVTLFCRHTAEPVEDIFSYYGVTGSFHVEQVQVPKVRFIRRMLYARAIIRDIKRLAEGPYVLYGRDYYVMGLIAWQGRLRVPMSLEIHQPPADRMQAWLQKQIFRSPYFQQLVVISQALADEYARLYGKLLDGKITVAHDGADINLIPPAMLGPQDYSQKSSVFKLGYIGSLYPGKGMDMIAQLASRVPECEFHVVGGKPEDVAAWKARCPEANLIFHGFVTPDRVYDYMAGFDAVLAPYQASVRVGQAGVDIARWMSPLKLFEYMAGGKPIICSDLPVLLEVMRDGENGLLAKAGDPEDWARQIRRMAADEALRARIGRQAQEEFFAHYTWEKRAEQLLAPFQPARMPDELKVV